MTVALVELRAAWERAGVAGVQEIPPAAGDEPDGLNEAERHEWMAWDAMREGRLGWAYVCIRAAAEHAADEGRVDDERRARAIGERLLAQEFPPYLSEGEALADIASWYAIREDEVDAGQAEASPTVDLRHRWLFRLLSTRRQRRLLSLDALAARLDLQPLDVLLLRVACVAADRSPIAARKLIEVVREPREAPVAWMARLDPRRPLAQHRLLHLTAAPYASLGHRAVEVDACIHAWIEGYDVWPVELSDVASFSAAPTAEHPWPAGRLDQIARSVRLALPEPLTLVHPDVREAHRLAVAIAGVLGTPLIVSGGSISSAQLRVIVREAKLRGALVVLDEVHARGLVLDLSGVNVVTLARSRPDHAAYVDVPPIGPAQAVGYLANRIGELGSTPPALDDLSKVLTDESWPVARLERMARVAVALASSSDDPRLDLDHLLRACEGDLVR